jgi:phage gpG-like protein
MASIIAFEVLNETEVQAKILGTSDRIQAQIVQGLDRANTSLQRHIVSDKLSGEVLKSHTGNLKRAILQIPATTDGTVISGRVGIGEEAWYGKIHEFGGVFSAQRHPKTLSEMIRKGRAGGRIYQIHFPERSFMRTSFAEMRLEIEEAIRSATIV